MKPNCYECKWRRDCIGSAHSQCINPKNKNDLENPMLNIMSIFASVGRVPPIQSGGVKVKGNVHGIKKGWFNYPFNFDPTWLEECDSFESK